MPSIFLRLGGYWYEIRPEDYFVEIYEDTCTFLFNLSQDKYANQWIIGAPAMRGYYVTFDYAKD